VGDPGGDGARENLLKLLGARVRAEVPIGALASKEEIAYAAPDYPRSFPFFAQARGEALDVRRDVLPESLGFERHGSMLTRLVSARGGLVVLAASAALLCATVPARAWYFPEHVVLSSDGQDAVPAEVRAVLGAAVADARKEGLTLCPRTDLRLVEALRDQPLETPVIRTPKSVACVPYTALSGLAADHASNIAELRAVLTTGAGLALVSAVAYEWRRFLDSARRSPSTLDRMSFVHQLDVALYFLDPKYVPRARATHVHFRDLGRSFETVLRDLAMDGRIDEVVARFSFHHLRSLVLARAGRRTDALLEHAFAVHFLQDAFASGHLVITPASWSEGRGAVRSRHDAFNADGLAVKRWMSNEPCSTSGAMEFAGLPSCWTTSGDGYLSLNADASDRQHAAAALARTEISFAMALDPDRLLAYAERLGDLELVSFAAKLNPSPWWTVNPAQRRDLPAGPKHAMRIVRAAAAAAKRLAELALPEAAAVDSQRLAGAVDRSVVSGMLDTPPLVVGDDDPPPETSAGHAVGLALLRPTLAQLPTAQGDTTAMHPDGHLDHGWAIQLFANAGATLLVPPRSPVEFMAPTVSLSGGFSYRSGTLLPGRRARAIAELNLGIAQTLHVDSAGSTGGSAALTLFDQELRWPVFWEALTQYNLPLDLASFHHAGRVLFLSGARSREVIGTGAVNFFGVELEAVAIALSDGYGSHPLYELSPELRFYVGLANPSATQPSFPAAIGPTFSIAVLGGYASQL